MDPWFYLRLVASLPLKTSHTLIHAVVTGFEQSQCQSKSVQIEGLNLKPE